MDPGQGGSIILSPIAFSPETHHRLRKAEWPQKAPLALHPNRNMGTLVTNMWEAVGPVLKQAQLGGQPRPFPAGCPQAAFPTHNQNQNRVTRTETRSGFLI